MFSQDAYRDEEKIISTGIPIIGKIEKLIEKSGNIKWLLSSKYPFFNERGEIIGTWGTSRDITSLKNAEEELARVNIELERVNKKLKILSLIDSLSGLYNHRYFSEEIDRVFNLYKRQSEKDESKNFSLILIDIDDFKNINDTYGHLIGDTVIKCLAEIMKENIRRSDICFRYGGDEFALLLLDTDKEEGIEIANKLRKIIEDSCIDCGGIELSITTSMGIASFIDVEKVKDLINMADENLYLSKRNGKNKIS